MRNRSVVHLGENFHDPIIYGDVSSDSGVRMKSTFKDGNKRYFFMLSRMPHVMRICMDQ